MIVKHVTSFELSKELKEAGYPQEECLFYWIIFKNGDKSLSIFSNLGIGDVSEENYEKYASPNSAELLKELPQKVKLWGKWEYLWISKTSIGDYSVQYQKPYYAPSISEHDENISNALAKTYIYLKDNELIKP